MVSTLLESIGNTPLVELQNISPKKEVKIFAKLESCNPGGSIKDRPAYWMIKNAEERGDLKKGMTILEPTSGNTGIALAMIGSAKGYKVKLVIPECVSLERRKILEAFGAEFVLTSGCQKTDGSIRKAHEMLKEEPDRYYMPNQFVNADNILSHYESTGPEIFKQCEGKIDAFVCGIGTSGTLMGTSKFLKEKIPDIKIVGVEPTLGHAIQGLKNMKEAIVPKIYDESIMDEKIVVEDNESFDMTRELATKEGIFAGMSSGAAVLGAVKYAEKITSGNIVVIIPDRGERYLSTTLFKSVCAKCPP